MNSIKYMLATVLLALGVASAAAPADEAQLRKTLQERIPRLGKIDEVTRTPMPGLFEIRVGTDIFYSDAEGNFLFHGMLIDTKVQKNLTEERQEKLLMVDFNTLPLKDAFTIVRGNGKRKIAVFEDPNCGYCKRFERDLMKVDNVTVHTFLYPILGPDSVDRSRSVWCAADKGAAWLDWMVRDKATPRAMCDSTALTRNLEFGRKHKITGTPTLFLANGTRVPGAITAGDLEKLLAEAK